MGDVQRYKSFVRRTDCERWIEKPCWTG